MQEAAFPNHHLQTLARQPCQRMGAEVEPPPPHPRARWDQGVTGPHALRRGARLARWVGQSQAAPLSPAQRRKAARSERRRGPLR